MASMEFGIRLIECEFDKFKKTIVALKDMINDKKANIIFGVNEDIRVEIDNDSLEKYSLEKDELDTIANKEFIPILLSLLEETDDSFIELQVRTFKNEKENIKETSLDEYRELVKSKIEYINEIFIDEQIKKRFIIKSTTKHSIISSIEWEINQKLYDAENDYSNSPTYATLKMIIDRNSNDNNPLLKILPFIQLEKKDEHILIDCDENDLDFLIKTLNDIKTKLIKIK
jgi:hypothetical protein